MAFNKAKALQEAEKSVSQGKLSQAIKQYLDIVEKEPSDLTLLNTVGDLYVRERNVSEALKQFHKLADSYVQEGYTVKAIAIYRKISKVDSNAVEPLIKLADLYQVQGLGREARDQYLQAVEFYKKKNQNDKAADLLRKVVQLEPESAQARSRLATFCEQIGRKEEAAQVYTEAAELALRRGELAPAEAALNKALGLNPKSPSARLLRARLALARHAPGEVEQIIASTPELKDDPAAKQLLLKAYLAAQKLAEAKNLVMEVYRTSGGDFAPLSSFSALCLEKGDLDAALKPLAEVADELIEKKDTAALTEALRRIWSKSGSHLPTLELLYRVCDKAADEYTIPEVLDALGHAYAQSGDFAKAEQAYLKLADREPENEQYKNLLKQVRQKQGKEVVPARAAELAREEVALTLDSEPVVAPPAEDAEQASMVQEALDNSDLFTRYNLPEKAVAELEKVLAVYPDQVDIHKRILEICRKNLPERAAQAASALARIHAQRGDVAGAKKYDSTAGAVAAPAALEEATPAPEPAAPPLEEVAPAPEPAAPPLEVVAPAPEPAAPPLEEPAPAPKPATPPAEEVAPPVPPPSPQPAAVEFDLTAEFAGAPAPAESPEPPVPQEAPAGFDLPTSPVAQPAPASAAQEVDLSGEWEASVIPEVVAPLPGPAPAAAAPFNFQESSVEIGFYLENGFEEEARKVVEELERRFPGNSHVAELRQRLGARAVGAAQAAAPEPVEVTPPPSEPVEAPPPSTPPSVEAPQPWELPGGYAARQEPEPTPPIVEAPAPPPVVEETPPPLIQAVPPPVVEAPILPPAPVQEVPPPVVEAPIPPPAPVQAAASPPPPPPPVLEAAPASGGADLLGDLAGDLASSLEGLASAAPPPAQPPPAQPPAAQPRAEGKGPSSPLSGLLEEMGGTTGEASAPKQDQETHYNLGVAFREMGLLEEAIGEFQKVVKGSGKGKYPPNFLQACSLLAVCFMDKKMPAVAVKWYTRALESPDLDEDSILALQYDLGMAYEMAGDQRTALEKFTEVYSQNIDFRDVAEKVRTLQQKVT